MNKFKFDGEEYIALRKQIIEDLIDFGYIEANPNRFSRPDIQDVLWYFHEKGTGDDMAREFYSYWDSLDWMVRKTRIKSWKGRAATWIKNNETYKNNKRQSQVNDDSRDWASKS